MSDKLPTDQYYIRNENTFAARNMREDRSLNPKGVFCPSESDPELWQLQALPNGRYRLKARGAPTGIKNKLLYAFLLDESRAEEWIITKRKDEGSRALYTIETASRNAGWTAQKGEVSSQIAVRPLIIGPSDPPFFPPNELWNIQPLVD
ncbi:serine protease inhibitor [Ramaria rubella]|nr:serine protease inhibitor [Ramaria rubella]